MDIDLDLIRSVVGSDRISVGESHLELHSKDESFHEKHRPDVVIWPQNSREISEILKIANRGGIPLTPWGAGTSIEGNPIPVRGGIILDMQKMNKVLEIRAKDLQVDLQAGVVYTDLNEHLSKYGLFFPPDPGAPATIGGMVANNASGIRTVKYGSTKDYVLRLEVVLPSGEIITTGSNAIKSSSGYDLTRLFAGSEGTLGVITEVTLRLAGLPKEVVAAVATFPSVRKSTDAVSQMMQSGLSPAALELLSPEVIQVINAFKGLNLDEYPMLFLEFHGNSKTSLGEELDFAKIICFNNDCIKFDAGMGVKERDHLWDARHNVYNAIRHANPRLSTIVVDTAVPISAYPELVDRARETTERKGIKGFIYGHAGDGNLHMDILADPEDEDEWDRAQMANEEIVNHAIDLRGTAAGESGIGIGKRKFMKREHGRSLEIMKAIKNLLDPNGIMNPGKIFDQPGPKQRTEN